MLAKFQKIFILTITSIVFLLSFPGRWAKCQDFPDKPIARLGKGTINSFAFSPDGVLFIVAGSAGVRFYDARNLTEIKEYREYGDTREILFSPDGEKLAMVRKDDVCFGDIGGNIISVLDIKGYSITLDSDWKILAYVSSQDYSSVHLWNLEEKKEIASLRSDDKYIYSICFSSDGEFLVSNGDGGICLWDVPGQKELIRFDSKCYAFSPDGKLLALGGIDNHVHLWDMFEQREMAILKGHSKQVGSLSFSPDGKFLASRDDMGDLYLWDVAMKKEISVFNRISGWESSFVFNPDGKILAFIESEIIEATRRYIVSLRLWNIVEKREIGSFCPAGQDDITDLFTPNTVLFKPDGKALAVIDRDFTIRLITVSGQKEIAILRDHDDGIRAIAASSDGRTIASVHEDAWGNFVGIHFWDIAIKKATYSFVYHATDASFSPGGRILVVWYFTDVIDGGEPIILWDMVEKKTMLYNQPPPCFAFSPDDKIFAYSRYGNTIMLWDTLSQKDIRSLRGHTGVIWSLAFSPDGKNLASCSEDNTVRLWDVAGQQEIAVFKGHTGRRLFVSFTPDSKILASTSWDDRIVRLWDVTEKREIAVLDNMGRGSFSPNGKYFFTGGHLWDIAEQRDIGVIADYGEYIFSPDSRFIAFYRNDYIDPIVRLWNTTSLEKIAVLKGSDSTVVSVAFSPDGKILITGCEDGTIFLWGDDSAIPVGVESNGKKPLTWGELKPDYTQNAVNHTNLLQNYPNPFNPDTWIPYQLSEKSDVSISIYDISGRLVRRLDLGNKQAGMYVTKDRAAYWDGRNDAGEMVSSGVYMLVFKVGDYEDSRRVVLIR